MEAATEIVRLVAEQLQEAGEMLGRAFFDNPMAVYLLPAAATRLPPLTWMFERSSRYGHLYGEVYTTASKVDGVAIWFPPDSPPMDLDRTTAAGMVAMPQELGQEAFQRLMVLKSKTDELRARDAPEPHWYLWTLGVDPPRQGQGVGGALMQPVLGRADAARLPCYLETDKEIDLTFYRKHGFEVVVEDDLPNGGMHYWTMKRPPQR